MYSGNEQLKNGTSSIASMLDFWRWAYSNISYSTQRGTFADYIVKCALERGGVSTRTEIGNGWEPYDLEGPYLPTKGRPSQIEVKAAGYLQEWDGEKAKNGRRLSFSIAEARVRDEHGDIKKSAPKQRNNDLYVFCVYTAKDAAADILDLSLWNFYVVPTFKFNEDLKYKDKKTVSLGKIEKMCGNKSLTFDELCERIIAVCAEVDQHEESYVHRNI